MNSFFDGLGRFVVRFRYAVLVFWVLLVIVSSALLPALGSEVNNNNTNFLPSTSPSSEANALAVPVIGSATTEAQLYLVLSRSGSALTQADQSAISAEVTEARKVGDVVGAKELGTSSDGQVAQILVTSNLNQMDVASALTLVDNLQKSFSQVNAPSGLDFYVAGQVATEVANNASSNKTGGAVQGLSILLIIVLLLFIFRALLAPFLTLLPSVFALLVASRFIGGLGAHGLKISEITELLLIILLLGAGTDYGLFLVFRVREEIRRGLEPKAAVSHALTRVGESISASAGTVILALLTLLFATFGIYNSLGVPLAVGVAVMLLAGLTLLPALLAIFGRAVFWPSKILAGQEKDGLWGKVAARLVRRPAVTLGIGVLGFGVLALFVIGYHSGGFGGATTAPAGSNAAKGNAIIAAHFPHSSTNPANIILRFDQPIWDDPSKVSVAQGSLTESKQFRQIAGPLTANGVPVQPALYAQLHSEIGIPQSLPAIEPQALSIPVALYNDYRSSAEYVSPSGETIQFEATFAAGDQSSTAALNAVPQVRDAVTAAAHAAGATDSGVAGEAAALYDISAASNHDLLKVFPIAILAIGLLLALVLRSLVAPLYLIVSVALSYLAALGMSTLLFIDIQGDGGLTFILPFLMFIFLLALGEDYNILVMTRIREEAHHYPLKEAVTRAVGKTGPTVTSAGLVLAGTFAVLAVAGGGGEVTDIGAGLAIGILMDTFLVRTLLVPSTVVLLGRWNWWPSKLSLDDPAPDADLSE